MLDPLPAGVRQDTGQGGLPRLSIHTPLCRGEFFLYGAQVTAWQPAGHQPVLWMSARSQYQAGKSLRGGVPICFPWFGPRAGVPGAPMHGLARLRHWTLDRVTADAAGQVVAQLSLASDADTRATWPHDFAVRFQVTFGAALGMALTVRNTGATAWDFEEALHTYLAVGDVRQVTVAGLEGATYFDKADNMARKVQPQGPVTVTSETDRHYPHTQATLELADPVLKRRLRVVKSGSNTSVVWNPWIAKAKAMPDFGDDEWPGMICLETVNAGDDRVTLAPGAEHTLTARIEVRPA